jgi:hypothetical protein
MPGLLNKGGFDDPLTMGLLGASQALMTPMSQGGGMGAAFNAFPAAQQQAMRQQAMQQEMLMRQQRMGMDQEQFGFERDQYQQQQKRAREQEERMQRVREGLAVSKPELLPLFDASPMEAMKRMFPEPAKPQVVAPGAALVVDNKAVFTQPDKPPAPSALSRLIQERDALPMSDPRRGMFDDAIRKETQHAPAVSVNTSTVFPKQMAGIDAKLAETDMGRWDAARGARASLRGLISASPGAAQGPAANAAVTGIDFLASLGIASADLQKVSADTAAFNSQATELILSNIKKLGANPSNADLQEIKKLVPQATQSRAARDRVAQILLGLTNKAELDARHRFNHIQQNQSSANWTPPKVNQMPGNPKQLMPGALYQHPVSQEIAIYKGDGKFETVVGDD